VAQRQYRVGICTDGKYHAYVRKWLRPMALCGAGRIVFKQEGWFGPDDLRACYLCANIVRTESKDESPD
jgi:hypothetical protein